MLINSSIREGGRGPPLHSNCRCNMVLQSIQNKCTDNQKDKITMAKTTSTAKGIRIGTPPPEAGNSNTSFWSLKDGNKVRATILANLDEIVSVDQYAIWEINPAPIWVDIGADDPGRDLGLKAGYRAFVPIKITVDGEEQVKLWSISMTIHRELQAIDDAIEGLKGAVLAISRTGAGKMTRYSIVPTGKKVTVNPGDGPTIQEIVDSLGPDTREGVIEMIEQRTSMPWSAVVKKIKGASEDNSDEEAFEVDEL
jgi:hypothetical protein